MEDKKIDEKQIVIQQRREAIEKEKKQQEEIKESQNNILLDCYSPEMQEMLKLAKLFALSGMFEGARIQAQAIIKILAGKEFGLSPLESVSSIYIIKGKICLPASMIAAFITTGGKYSYEIVEHTAEKCSIKFFKISGEERKELGISTFTWDMAVKAKLSTKDTYVNFPENMMFVRALSNGAKWYCPDIFRGCGTIEEMEGVTEERPKTVITIEPEKEKNDKKTIR